MAGPPIALRAASIFGRASELGREKVRRQETHDLSIRKQEEEMADKQNQRKLKRTQAALMRSIGTKVRAGDYNGAKAMAAEHAPQLDELGIDLVSLTDTIIEQNREIQRRSLREERAAESDIRAREAAVRAEESAGISQENDDVKLVADYAIANQINPTKTDVDFLTTFDPLRGELNDPNRLGLPGFRGRVVKEITAKLASEQARQRADRNDATMAMARAADREREARRELGNVVARIANLPNLDVLLNLPGGRGAMMWQEKVQPRMWKQAYDEMVRLQSNVINNGVPGGDYDPYPFELLVPGLDKSGTSPSLETLGLRPTGDTSTFGDQTSPEPAPKTTRKGVFGEDVEVVQPGVFGGETDPDAAMKYFEQNVSEEVTAQADAFEKSYKEQLALIQPGQQAPTREQMAQALKAKAESDLTQLRKQEEQNPEAVQILLTTIAAMDLILNSLKLSRGN